MAKTKVVKKIKGNKKSLKKKFVGWLIPTILQLQTLQRLYPSIAHLFVLIPPEKMLPRTTRGMTDLQKAAVKALREEHYILMQSAWHEGAQIFRDKINKGGLSSCDGCMFFSPQFNPKFGGKNADKMVMGRCLYWEGQNKSGNKNSMAQTTSSSPPCRKGIKGLKALGDITPALFEHLTNRGNVDAFGNPYVTD